MLGSLILYLKGTRILMFQLSGFYCINSKPINPQSRRTALARPNQETPRVPLKGSKRAPLRDLQ